MGIVRTIAAYALKSIKIAVFVLSTPWNFQTVDRYDVSDKLHSNILLTIDVVFGIFHWLAYTLKTWSVTKKKNIFS